MNTEKNQRNCPVCDSALAQKAIAPIVADECNQCGGILFESDEFRLAKDAADSDLEWMDFEVFKAEDSQAKKSTRNCPMCHHAMLTVSYATTGVEIETCADCKAIWLDKGEFQKILAALDSEANAKGVLGHFKSTLREGGEILNGPESLVSEWKDFTKACQFLGRRCVVENPKLFSAISVVQKVI